MKKYLGFIVLVLATNLFAIKNWNYYTNTTHIRDLKFFENKIYLATWGGLAIYDLTNNAFEKTYTTISNLEDNDLRCLEYYPIKNQLLIGTTNKGINRFSNDNFAIPLNEILGLASNTVNQIVNRDSLIVAATENGISIFLDNENFPFPLLQNNYNIDDGLLTNSITNLQISESGYMFCGSMLGLNYVHLDSLEISTAWYTVNLPFSNCQINSISMQNNLIAVGTPEGLAVSSFPNFDWTVYNDFGSIFPVFIDSNEDIWFGTGRWNEADLLVEDETTLAILQLQTENGIITTWQNEDLNITDAQIMGFNETDNSIYAYSWGDGFLKLNHEKQIWTQHLQNCIGANLVTDIEIDKNDKVWISNGIYALESNNRCAKGLSCLNNNNWTLYNKEQYPSIKTNNILDIEIDENNKKWITCWQLDEIGNGGVTVFDEENDFWQILSNLPSSYYTSATFDEYEKMWLNSSNSIDVVEINSFTDIERFEPYNHAPPGIDKYIWCSLISEDKAYFGYINFGLKYWNSSTFPETDGDFWENAPSSELQESKIYQMVENKTTTEKQIWIVSSGGLFMFDESDWFKYGTHIKKRVWQPGGWHDEATSEYWYFEGQERLYGGQTTYPTALFIDPFGVIWIGTKNAGITAYDVDKNIFTNYTMGNSPLISNNITDFAYNSTNGILFIGTDEGLNSAQIGISENMNFEENLNKTFCYPNPFYPENGEILKIDNTNAISMPKGDTKCNIYSLDGKLVRVLTKNNYQQFEWNGTNVTEQKCSSGLYFYVVFTQDAQTSNGKIVLIR